MIVSRDINATKELEARAFTVEVIPMFRRYYNSLVYDNPNYNAEDSDSEEPEPEEDVPKKIAPDFNDARFFYLDIPFPEEFIRSPLKKFVRFLGCSFHLKTYEDENKQDEALERFWDEDTLSFKLEAINITNDLYEVDDFDTDFEIRESPHINVHCNLAQNSTLMNDSFVCQANNYNPLLTSSTFEVHTTQRSFRVWFVDEVERKILNLYTVAKKLSAIRLKMELVY